MYIDWNTACSAAESSGAWSINNFKKYMCVLCLSFKWEGKKNCVYVKHFSRLYRQNCCRQFRLCPKFHCVYTENF
jgi:hypothetical protein